MLGTLLLFTPAISAKEAPVISTDRPDFVEASLTVGKGYFQIETSVNSERTEVAGVKTTILAMPTLLRYGFAEAWELRLETEAFQLEEEETTGTTQGFSDISLGVKWHTHDGEVGTAMPSIGWLVHADLDSGSAGFSGHGVRPSFRAVAEWELPDGFSLGVMPGVIYDNDDKARRFTAGIFAAVVGKAWTDKFKTFLEFAGQQLAAKKHGGNIITYNVGGAYLLRNNLQVDTAVSLGTTVNSPDISWTVGVSTYF